MLSPAAPTDTLGPCQGRQLRSGYSLGPRALLLMAVGFIYFEWSLDITEGLANVIPLKESYFSRGRKFPHLNVMLLYVYMCQHDPFYTRTWGQLSLNLLR